MHDISRKVFLSVERDFHGTLVSTSAVYPVRNSSKRRTARTCADIVHVHMYLRVQVCTMYNLVQCTRTYVHTTLLEVNLFSRLIRLASLNISLM